MDSVKSFALSACISMVIGSIISMIVPNIEKNRIIKLLLSAFVLAGLISPLLSVFKSNNLFKNINTYETNVDADYGYNKNILEDIENSASESLYPIIKDELSRLGFYDDFGVKVEILDKKEGIEVESVNINVWDLHSIEKEKLQVSLTEKTGLPIKIKIKEAEE